MDMRILVTGNLGYIGSVLGKHLKNNISNIDLIGIDTGLYMTDYTKSLRPGDTFYDTQIYKDVRSLDGKEFINTDTVIALAAISNDPMGRAFSSATYQINRDAVIENAKLAKKMGVKKFIFASSCSVYGAGGNKAKDESDDVNPLTDYAKSKIEAELELRKLADKNFQVICLRFATACGASDRTRLDLVLNDFVWTYLSQNHINILSDGTPLRPVIDINDMARAMSWASQNKCEDQYLVLNCGNNINNFSVLDLALKVCSDDSNLISINPAAEEDKRSYKVNFSKYENITGFKDPLIPIELTIKNLCDQFISILDNTDNHEILMSKYKRHNKLNSLMSKGLLTNDIKWK